MLEEKKKNFISKEGYEKLLSELNELKKIKLPEVLERLSEAKSLGDLSENFEYKSSLEEKDLVHSRVAELEELVSNAEIISDTKSKKGGVIDYGAKVVLELDGKKKCIIQIVGTGEVEIGDKNKISFQSPVGKAIKGKKKGDNVQMRVNNEKQDIKVLDVKY